MRKTMFKNVNLLISEREEFVFEKLISEPDHKDVDLTKAIETDSEGRITFFSPPSGMQWSLIFLIQNLSISQRLYEMDKFFEKNKVE